MPHYEKTAGILVLDDNVRLALELGWDDFEDSIQYIVGENLIVEYIITRNLQDFKHGSISAVAPEEFLRRFMPTEMN